jgi:hypothetical protein
MKSIFPSTSYSRNTHAHTHALTHTHTHIQMSGHAVVKSSQTLREQIVHNTSQIMFLFLVLSEHNLSIPTES